MAKTASCDVEFNTKLAQLNITFEYEQDMDRFGLRPLVNPRLDDLPQFKRLMNALINFYKRLYDHRGPIDTKLARQAQIHKELKTLLLSVGFAADKEQTVKQLGQVNTWYQQ